LGLTAGGTVEQEKVFPLPPRWAQGKTRNPQERPSKLQFTHIAFAALEQSGGDYMLRAAICQWKENVMSKLFRNVPSLTSLELSLFGSGL
jgi:hypothetical protein